MKKKINPPVEGFRLSPQQQRLWLQQADQALPYRIQAEVSIEGKLDARILKIAIDRVVERHEILRSTFAHLPGSRIPVQVINETLIPLFREHDFSTYSAQAQQTKIETLSQEAIDRPFDFSRGPLLHISLITLSPEKALLLVGLPALCADAVGLNNFVREIGHSYAACLRNEELSGEVAQYADIAEWQNEILEGEDGKSGRAFWQKQDAASLLRLGLPFENQPPGQPGFEPKAFNAAFDLDMALKIQMLAQQHETSTATLLLTCWQILLWRLTGQKELVIGTAHDGREYEELKEVLGLFEKYLPLLCHLEANSRFSDLLAQVHESVEEIYKWQEFFSWEQIVRSTGNDVEPFFFPICFAFEAQALNISAAECSFTAQRQYVCVDRFKIKLACIQRGEMLEMRFHYDNSLFQAADIQRLAGQFRVLVESVISSPDTPIGKLQILSDAERQKVLVEFNDTQAAYPKDKCIHQLIEEQAERTPGNIAVVFEDQQLSYAALNARANQLAHYLQALGVGPNVLVAICMERSLELIVGILGILKAGGVYVPLDPTYPRERLAFMLEDAGAQVLLTEQRVGSELHEHQAQASPEPSRSARSEQRRRVLYLDTGWEAVAKESAQPPAAGVAPQDLAYVIYTSGSTGKPKGVIVTHQSLVSSNSARTAYYSDPVDKFLLLSSIAFDSSVVGIFWTLTRGGTLLLIREESQKDPNRLAEQIAENQVSHLLTLPSFYGLILEQAKSQQFNCLRTVIVAGEPCPKTLVDSHKKSLRGTSLFSEYGATETTVFSSIYNCFSQRLNIAPIGHPIANARIYLLDSSLQPVPIGAPGEVYFGGDGIAQGYLNRPDLTAEKFIPDPFSKMPGTRLYQSGDLARRLPDGDVEFLGRIDHQVKIRGYRIELGEVEATLSQNPAIKEVAVLAIGDEPQTKRLVAYVVPVARQSLAVNELRRFLMEKLPDFMVPSTFVFLSAFPRTPNGKVDRRALPPPSVERPGLNEAFVAPHTSTEKVLAEIWAGVLGLEQVGVHDNFFELGGDSILSIQIISKANQAGLRLTPMQIFQHQSIAELARVAGTARAIKAEQGEVKGQLPLTPIQHWFFEQNVPDPHHWNIPLLVEVRQALDPALLERAVRKLLAHHDALRLRFSPSSGWQQTISPLDELAPVDSIDLSAFDEAGQQAAFKQQATEFQASLNLEKGPLMRLVLFDFGAHQPSRLLWVLHHLVGDVVSWRILLEDLQTALQQLGRGEAIHLPPKTTSFKRWAEQLTEHAQSGALHGERDYWLAEQRARVLRLPVDFPKGRDANTVASDRTVKVELSAEETRVLLQEVPKAYNTQINDVLLTALVQSFSQWTGTRSLLIDLEGHGREQIFDDVDLSRTVGWFTTSFPVVLTLGGDDNPGDALKSIKEQLRRIPNRGIGYGLLRYLSEDVGIVEKLRAFPQPEINFNYLGQFDQVLQNSSLFALLQESSGADRSLGGRRPHLLEIVGCVIGGRLQADWSYSKNVYRRSTIEGLAKGFVQALRSLITHCQSPGAGGYTPSDFAEFKWGQADLDNIAAAIRNAKGEV